MNKTTLIYYSATGTAKKIATTICTELGGASATHDLLRSSLDTDICFDENELVVIGTPVYSGRVPPTAIPGLLKLRGNNTPAIAAVTYGGRAYDDALLELKDILEAQGFIVIGAGAFLARHAVFPRYEVERPDSEDLSAAKELAQLCSAKLEKLNAFPGTKRTPVEVKGKRPYVKPQELPIYPTPDSSCISCGACAKICPVKAIDPANLKGKPKGCISCAACTHVCPQKARKFRNLIYYALDILFIIISALKKSKRKESEIFI